MDFDLLSGFLDDKYVESSVQLLSSSQRSGRLTQQQTAKTVIASKDGVSNERDISATAVERNQAGAVINKIEDIFESIADCIIDEGKELVIPLKSRPKIKNIANKEHSTRANRVPKIEARNITFPSRSPQEAWKFSR
jgi:meiotic recombination protein SPO11